MGWPLGFSRVRITPRTVNRAQIAYLHIPKSFLSVPLWPSDSGVWTLMRRHGDSRLVFHNPNDLHARKDAAKWAAGQIGSWLPMLPLPRSTKKASRKVHADTQRTQVIVILRVYIYAKRTVLDVYLEWEVYRSIPPYPHPGPSYMYYTCMKGSIN